MVVAVFSLTIVLYFVAGFTVVSVFDEFSEPSTTRALLTGRISRTEVDPFLNPALDSPVEAATVQYHGRRLLISESQSKAARGLEQYLRRKE